jgi:hypothetical protein
MKLVAFVGAFVIFGGTTVFLAMWSLSRQVPEKEAMLLCFWGSVVWAIVLGALLFTRIRRQDFWVRFYEAEVSIRSRFGLRVETQQVRVVKWFNIVAGSGLTLCLLSAAISAESLPSASEMTPAEHDSMDFVCGLDSLTTGPHFECVWIWIPEEDTDQDKKYRPPLDELLSKKSLGKTRGGGTVAIEVNIAAHTSLASIPLILRVLFP